MDSRDKAEWAVLKFNWKIKPTQYLSSVELKGDVLGVLEGGLFPESSNNELRGVRTESRESTNIYSKGKKMGGLGVGFQIIDMEEMVEPIKSRE